MKEQIKEHPFVFWMYLAITWICWMVPVHWEITIIITLLGIINIGLGDDVIAISALRKNENKDEYIKNKEALSTIKIRLNNFIYILSVAMIVGINLHKYFEIFNLFFPILLVFVLLFISVLIENFELFVIKQFKKYFS